MYIIGISVVSWSKRPGTNLKGPNKGPCGGPLQVEATPPKALCIDDAVNGLCGDQRGIDATVFPYLP